MALCAPQDFEVRLLRDDRVAPEGASFSYAIEADNGIATNVQGAPGAEGAAVMTGSYQ